MPSIPEAPIHRRLSLVGLVQCGCNSHFRQITISSRWIVKSSGFAGDLAITRGLL
jgi:hypothetical protein